MNQTFGKEYKLCSKKTIDALFQEGQRLNVYPLHLTYQLIDQPNSKAPFQVVTSVPKRQFKRAHDRNYIKRLLRESLRLNKAILEDFLVNENLKNKQLVLFLVYRDNKQPEYQFLFKKVNKLLLTLVATLEKNEK